MKRTFILLLALILAFGSVGCGSVKVENDAGKVGGTGEYKRFEAEFLNLFDTMTRIVGYAATEEEFKERVDFLYGELEQYHQFFDIYNNYEGVNNIKTINDNAGIAPVKVDQKIIDFIDYSKEIYALTDQKVNIAFGSVLSLWHDYREAGIDEPEKAQIPPMELLKQAALHIDINKIIVDKEASTVFLSEAQMSLDVGAIAKGYGVEQACKAAEERFGKAPTLVSVGGNVRAIGDKDANGAKWKVGVQDPKGGDESLRTVGLSDGQSLVTSGDYQRYYTVDGKPYHHIIDPQTLLPAEYFSAVTIICKDSGLADGLSTGAYLMDFEQGRSLVESLDGAGALYVLKDGTIVTTKGFPSV